MNTFTTYITSLTQSLLRVDTAVLSSILTVLQKARQSGSTIYIFGNGGSASTASHFAADVAKNTRGNGLDVRIICLNDCVPLLTAYGNDEGYGAIFERPLTSLIHFGDVVIGISTSGESENVVRAVETADRLGAITVALTGKGGGRLRDKARYWLAVPGETIEQVEDGHLAVCHWLVQGLKGDS